MNTEQSGIRINKFLSAYGICSRREADRHIAAGEVTIAGRTAGIGDRVKAGDTVCLKGKPVNQKDDRVLLLFYKPRGVVCTAQKKDRNNIIDYIDYPVRVYPVGRLDQDSEGLILLTNYGPLANWMTHPSFGHEKEYIVRIDRPVTDEFLRRMGGGVPILGKVTNPCTVKKRGEREFSIILTQGMNRQIRRMCEYFGCRVVRLRRIRVMGLHLGSLAAGEYREATEKEWAALLSQMEREEKRKKTGGDHVRSAAENEGAGTKAKRRRQGILSGEPRNPQ